LSNPRLITQKGTGDDAEGIYFQKKPAHLSKGSGGGGCRKGEILLFRGEKRGTNGKGLGGRKKRFLAYCVKTGEGKELITAHVERDRSQSQEGVEKPFPLRKREKDTPLQRNSTLKKGKMGLYEKGEMKLSFGEKEKGSRDNGEQDKMGRKENEVPRAWSLYYCTNGKAVGKEQKKRKAGDGPKEKEIKYISLQRGMK